MLTTVKTINLNGESKIGGTTVAYLSANITEAGNSTISKSIANIDLYNANRTEVRNDISAFETEVYAIEDSLVTTTTSATA